MFLQSCRASINDNNHTLHTMQEADSEKMLKGVQSVVTELYTVSVVFYVIGLMDYSACSNITGNTACNNYRQFMLANLIISHIIFCIPEEICQPAMSILKAVIGFVFTLCHAAFLGMAMNPDSKCPDEISAGCDAQAFKGYNILHYYSLICLGTLAVALGLVVIFSICSCATSPPCTPLQTPSSWPQTPPGPPASCPGRTSSCASSSPPSGTPCSSTRPRCAP